MLRPNLNAFWTLSLVFFLALSGPEQRALADPQTYADLLMARVLKEQGLSAEPNPAGKKIEKIVIVPLDVLVKEDPWPEFPNAIHAITKPEVIRRELLFEEGQAWDQKAVDETARNLRSFLLVSLARIDACQGSQPDSVIAVVLTKDLWSFRPSISFSLVGPVLQYFQLFFAEYNVAGHMKTVGPEAGLDLSTFWFGQQYRDPRLFGTRVSLKEKADLLFNQTSGLPEGGIVNLEVEKPLFALNEQWAWKHTFGYRRDVYRLYLGPGLMQIPLSTGEVHPLDYRRQELRLESKVRRSMGDTFKLVVSGGARLWGVHYEDYESGFSSQGAAEYAANFIPVSEGAVGLLGQVSFYRTQFSTFHNIERFALTEDYQLGPDAELELLGSLPIPGLISGFADAKLRMDWTETLGGGDDDLLSAGGQLVARYDPSAPVSPWTNLTVGLHARNVSPRFWIFRFVASGRFTRRIRELAKTLDSLGGDGALRGYPVGYLFGNQSWGANIELRTIPWVFHTLHLGGVAFLDMGDANGPLPGFGMHASVGLGARVSFPQFNKSLMRVDLGFPLESLGSITPSYFTMTFGQAFF